MSRERELLKKILAAGWLNNELSNEVEELLAQPEIRELLTQKREPLSYEATSDMFHASKQAVIASCYWAGIRDAEKAHGIRGGE